MKKFAYEGEQDKTYGVVGMVMSLSAWDQVEMLRQISLDADDSEAIAFVPEFFVYQNPRMSAKAVWNEGVKHYQILMGLIVGNILCRKLCYKKETPGNAFSREIYDVIERDGIDECQLEADEVNMIYRKVFNYLSDLYTDRRVAMAVDAFAKELQQRRTMSGPEVIEELHILRIG